MSKLTITGNALHSIVSNCDKYVYGEPLFGRDIIDAKEDRVFITESGNKIVFIEGDRMGVISWHDCNSDSFAKACLMAHLGKRCGIAVMPLDYLIFN